jgi:hypothetical protein
LEKVGSTRLNCVTADEMSDQSYNDHSFEITAMGEARIRDDHRSAVHKQQQVQPLGFSAQFLGFSLPFLSIFQTGNSHLCTSASVGGGVLQHFPCLHMSRLHLKASTKEFLPSDCQTMPASGTSRVGEASCHSCSYHQLQAVFSVPQAFSQPTSALLLHQSLA